MIPFYLKMFKLLTTLNYFFRHFHYESRSKVKCIVQTQDRITNVIKKKKNI